MASIIVMEKGQIVQTHQNYVGVKRTIRNLSQYQTADAAPGHYLKYREKRAKEHEVKVLGLDDVFTFGKYKNKTIREVIDADWNYVKWAIIESQRLLADIDSIIEYHRSNLKTLQPDDLITFGKYRGKTLQSVYNDDVQYLKWMESQNPDFIIDWEELTSESKS